MLQGIKEFVQGRQRTTMRRPQLLDDGDSVGEFSLQGKGREDSTNAEHLLLRDVLHRAARSRRATAKATAARVIKHARQFFTAALRDDFVGGDPFAKVKSGSMENRERMYFVSRADAEKLITAAPNHHWRLVVALARHGGLRTPSEPLALTWGDVDWEKGKVLIRSPKTGNRWIPLFPELRPHLEEAFDRTEPGEVYVVTKTRNAGSNFRTIFEKIILRAGPLPWEKPFQNLRSSRETELAATHPLHVVTAWIGNSVAVAAKHYLQVTDGDFLRASSGGSRGAAESGAVRSGQE